MDLLCGSVLKRPRGFADSVFMRQSPRPPPPLQLRFLLISRRLCSPCLTLARTLNAAYMSSPAHIELILSEKEVQVSEKRMGWSCVRTFVYVPI